MAEKTGDSKTSQAESPKSAAEQFPTIRYHPSKGAKVVNTAEDLKALGSGWAESPDFGKAGREASEKQAEKAADKQAEKDARADAKEKK